MTFEELVAEASARQRFDEWFDFVSEEELQDDETAQVQAAWYDLQAVPSYVSRDKSAETRGR